MVSVGQCKLHQPLSWKMCVIQYALLCNNGDTFLKKIHNTLAHIVDYNVCKIYFNSFSSIENNALNTTPFVKLIRNKFTYIIYDLYYPP